MPTTEGYINTGASAVSAIGNYIASQVAISAAKKKRSKVLEATKGIQQQIVDQGEEQAIQFHLQSFAALQDASAVERFTSQEAAGLRRQGARAQSTIVAAAGASGLDLVGSPLLALGEAVYETELRAQHTQTVGALQARQYQFAAQEAVRAAQVTRRTAKNQATAAGLQGAGLLDNINAGIQATQTAGAKSLANFGFNLVDTYKTDLASILGGLTKPKPVGGSAQDG